MDRSRDQRRAHEAKSTIKAMIAGELAANKAGCKQTSEHVVTDDATSLVALIVPQP